MINFALGKLCVMRKILLTSLIVFGFVSSAFSQEEKEFSYIPQVGGTLRAKYEYQTDVKNSRFQVRDARVGVKGWLAPFLDYKAAINLSEKGKIRTHDLYTRFHIGEEFKVTAGQFRVPISVDAARSPHSRLFANRSFIAKQVGNVFDIGVKGSYQSKKIPFGAEFGVYNGMDYSLSDEVWLRHFLYVGRLNYNYKGLNIVAAAMTNKPDLYRINMYEGCISYTFDRFFFEGEFVYKDYLKTTTSSVYSYNIMGMYCLPIKSKYMNKLMFMGRFDAMTDNSDGFSDESGNLIIDDSARKRVSVGTTLAYHQKVKAELRLNYEHYFYEDGVEIGPSDHSKLVAEVMFYF